MPEIEYLAEELLLQLRISDSRYSYVLVSRHRVTTQSRREIGNVSGNLFNEHPSHFRVPYCLGSVEVTEKNLRKLVGSVILEITYHRVRQQLAEYTSLHDV